MLGLGAASSSIDEYDSEDSSVEFNDHNGASFQNSLDEEELEYFGESKQRSTITTAKASPTTTITATKSIITTTARAATRINEGGQGFCLLSYFDSPQVRALGFILQDFLHPPYHPLIPLLRRQVLYIFFLLSIIGPIR